jgi:hypothetical protein
VQGQDTMHKGMFLYYGKAGQGRAGRGRARHHHDPWEGQGRAEQGRWARQRLTVKNQG